LAVGGFEHRVTLAFEVFAHQGPQFLLVVDDQYRGAHEFTVGHADHGLLARRLFERGRKLVPLPLNLHIILLLFVAPPSCSSPSFPTRRRRRRRGCRATTTCQVSEAIPPTTGVKDIGSTRNHTGRISHAHRFFTSPAYV